MKKNTRLIFIVSILATAGVLLLQLAWLHNYYLLNNDRFDKDINLAFEDAVRKEFNVSCDTIQEQLFHFLMDTTQIRITSNWSEKYHTYQYTITNVHDTLDKHQFAHQNLHLPILSQHDSIKAVVAGHYAQMLRSEDFQNHIIYYHTQNIGNYLVGQTKHYEFDTIRLRPIFAAYLAQRNIHEPFRFYLRNNDSASSQSHLPDSLRRLSPFITRSMPTYLFRTNNNYVRAGFHAPVNYLRTRMLGMLAGSLLLFLTVGFALSYLIRIIYREKKLSTIKNDFISNMSHELKTPIATISAALEAMQHFDALRDPEKTHRYLHVSQKELARLSDMVSKILDISLYEKENIPLTPTQIPVAQLLRELIHHYTIGQHKPATFHFTPNPTITNVYADKALLHQALSNLIDNAVKYGNNNPEITITTTIENGYVVITITDNGPGITPQDMPYIFDKFYRVPSATQTIKGYGLGLAYVQHIVARHGGWCKAESRLRYGSTFKLGFPV